MVPKCYEQEKSLGIWVSNQRRHQKNNKLRLARKELLDQIEFAWNARARALRSSTSTTDVRGLAIAI
jgi:hypothetical protein